MRNIVKKELSNKNKQTKGEKINKNVCINEFYLLNKSLNIYCFKTTAISAHSYQSGLSSEEMALFFLRGFTLMFTVSWWSTASLLFNGWQEYWRCLGYESLIIWQATLGFFTWWWFQGSWEQQETSSTNVQALSLGSLQVLHILVSSVKASHMSKARANIMRTA